MAGPTRVTEVTAEGLRNFSWTPSDFGLNPSPLDSLQVAGPEQSAAVIREVLRGALGPARDIVLLNAAAALWTAGLAASPRAVRRFGRGSDRHGHSLRVTQTPGATLQRTGRVTR